MARNRRATRDWLAAEWASETDPRRMVAMLRQRGGTSDRKWRLFVTAFWRWQAARLHPPGDLMARTDAMEQWAESGKLPRGRRPSRSPDVIFFSRDAARSAELTADAPFGWPWGRATSEATAIQPRLLRELFGNPFRPPAPDPRWRTADVLGLATAIYEDRAFDRLPLLADALLDAGCEDEAIISHCRSPGPHVRGCWVLDLLLGHS